MFRRSLVVPAAVLLAAGAIPFVPRAAHADAPLAPVFTHPVWVDAQRDAGEPDITVGYDGRYYVSAPWGVTTDTSFLWRSEDGGNTFRQIQGAPGNQNPYNYRAGGDTEFHAFPAAGGPLAPGQSAPAGPSTLYFDNQDNLDSQTCGYSTDAGRTFNFTDPSQPLQGELCGGTVGTDVGADRQWLAETRVDPTVSANNGVLNHDINYLWYDHYQNGGNTLGRSDNGISYTLGPSGQGGGNPGNIVADPTSGAVYVTTTIGGGAYVGYSADGGKTLTKTNITGGGCTGNTATDFSVIAIDTAGNLYIVYACQDGTNAWRVFFSRTTGFTNVNNGTRSVPVASGWTTPIPITGSGTGAPSINYAVFPWVTAGDPGRVDVAFYGTTQATGYDPNSENAQWNTYVLQDLTAFSDSLPVACGPPPPPGQSCPGQPTTSPQLVAVAEAPTHLASICFNGIGCTGPPQVGGNRNLLDFFEVTHDANGMADVVYNDDGNQMFAAWPGGPFDMVARQVGGPSLYNAVGSLNGATPTDVSSVNDPAGDGQYPTSDTSIDSLDLLQAGASLKDPSTVEVTFTVKNLSSAFQQLATNAPTEAAGATGITYLLVWKYNNDVWFTSAKVDPSGNFTYWAGRPQSDNFTATGGPKYAIYDAGSNANAISTASVDTTKGTITIDVPASDLGNVVSGTRLLDATGFSLVDRAAGTASTTPALADQADETTAFDDTLAIPTASTPEVPWTPALIVLGLAGIAGAGLRRRRLLQR
ncbi:MAG: hypothetical protein ABR498_07195 [Candidatus Dormibacteria bacterium]